MNKICELPFVITVLQELLFEIFEVLQMSENSDEDVHRRVPAATGCFDIYMFKYVYS